MSSDQTDRGSQRSSLLLLGLVSLHPFLTFVSNNTTEELDFTAIGTAWSAIFLLTLALFALSRNLIANPIRLRRAVNTQAVFVFLLFMYGSAMPLIRGLGFLQRTYHFFLLWGLVVTLLLIVVWILSKSEHSVRFLTVVVSAMMVVPVLNIGIFVHSYAKVESSETTGAPDESPTKHRELPNVYHFIFDGYGRADHLLEETGFDSNPFFRELDQWGFQVIEQANSNYMYTYPSIATMLDMEYLVVPGDTSFGSIFREAWVVFKDGPENPSTAELENKAMGIRTGRSTALRMFESLGYVLVRTVSGTGDCPPATQDICIKREPLSASLGETTWGLLDATPFGIIFRRLFTERIAYFEKDGRSFLPELAPKIQEVVGKASSPLFVYSHILLPHRPFLREDCSSFPYGYFRYPEDEHEEMSYQSTTLECLHQHIREVMPELIHSDPEAIVILSADHGFAYPSFFQKPMSQMSEEEIARRFGILLSIRAPEQCQSMLYPTMSPVNIYRFVRACLRNEKPDYLPDRSYLYTQETFVTNRHEPVEIIPWEPQL